MTSLGKPLFYYSKEINGQIVDAETGNPIEGIVIVAKWVPYYPNLASGGHSGVYMVSEGVTDKEGKFHIPSWGPLPAPMFGHLDVIDPHMYLFKKGYKLLDLTNIDVQKLGIWRDSKDFKNLLRVVSTSTSPGQYLL